MNFCEKCNVACEGERCPSCGGKKLREIDGEDVCFIAVVENMFGEYLRSRLGEEGIDCVLVPHGTGARSKLALPMEEYRLYAKYKNADAIIKLLEQKDFNE